MYNTFKLVKTRCIMECKICNEKDESKLVLRSTVVNQKVETIQICTSCLWEKLLNDENDDGNLLSGKESIEGRVFNESEFTHS